MKLFEDIDPQYLSIRRSVIECGTDNLAYAFFVNALVAYKLRMRGEDFWNKFAEFIISNCNKLRDTQYTLNLVREYTYRYNNYAYNNKLKRITKIAKCSDILDYITGAEYLSLAKKLAECLETSYIFKTIVFSTKIVYYFHKAQGTESVLPFELPIPVDRRVAYMSYTSGAIDIVHEPSGEDIAGILMKKANIIRDVWNEIASTSLIPPLHIDAVIWYFGRYSHISSKQNILGKAYKDLYTIIDKNMVKQLVDELYFRLPE